MSRNSHDKNRKTIARCGSMGRQLGVTRLFLDTAVHNQMSHEQAAYRSFSMVSGYHRWSYPPRIAFGAGLRHRFALVLSSYRPDKGEMFFDAELYVSLARAILALIPHDVLEIDMGDSLSTLGSVAEMAHQYALLNETERDPPVRMQGYKDSSLVVFEETECWNCIGGPEPYHDSFTLSFYTAENLAAEIRRVCGAVANESEATITAFHEGAAFKMPFVPWWMRPLRWLGRKNW